MRKQQSKTTVPKIKLTRFGDWLEKPDESIPKTIRRTTLREELTRRPTKLEKQEISEYWQARRLAEEEEAEAKKQREEAAKASEEAAYKDFLEYHPALKMVTEAALNGSESGSAAWIARVAFNLSETVGSGVDKSLTTAATSTGGRITMNNESIVFAQDAKEYNRLQLERRELVKDLSKEPKNSPSYYAIADAVRNIDDRLNDKDFQDRVNTFKRRMVDNQLTQGDRDYEEWLKKHPWGYAYDQLKNRKDMSAAAAVVPRIAHWFDKNRNTIRDYIGEIVAAPFGGKDMFKNDPDLKARAEYLEKQTGAAIYRKKMDEMIGSDQDLSTRVKKENKYIDDLVSRIDRENKELKEDYTDILKFHDKARQYFQVSRGYNELSEMYQDKGLLDWEYWFYVMPGTIGSSNSSKNQATATLLQTAAPLAGAATALSGGSAAAAEWTMTGIIGAALPFQIAGGYDENYAEVQERYYKNLKTALTNPNLCGPSAYEDIVNDLYKKSVAYWRSKGMSEDWIKLNRNLKNESGINGILGDAGSGIITTTDPRFKVASENAFRGLQALFEADNMRTMTGNLISSAAQCTPVGSAFGWIKNNAMKVTEKALGTVSKSAATKFRNQFASEVIADVDGKLYVSYAGKKAANKASEATASKYSNGFRKKEQTYRDAFNAGYKVGATAADAGGFGYAGHVLGGLTVGAANMGKRAIKNSLGRKASAAIDMYTEAFLNKYQGLLDKLFPVGSLQYIAAKYGLRWGKNQFIGAMEEGAEEGVQYLNSLEDYASKYGYDGMSLGALIGNDLRQGGRAFESWLSLIGLGNSEVKDDAEYWNNVKGGFALGGGMTTITRTYRDVKSAIGDYRVNQALVNSSIFNREAAAISRANDRVMVDQVAKGNGQYLINILTDRAAADRRRENPNFTEDMYEQRIREVRMMEHEVNNKVTNDILDAKGIKKGTLEYNTAIADIVNLKLQRQANQEQQQEVTNRLNQLQRSKEFNEDVSRTQQYTDDDLESLSRQKRAGRNKYVQSSAQKKTDEEAKRREDAYVKGGMSRTSARLKVTTELTNEDYYGKVALAEAESEAAERRESLKNKENLTKEEEEFLKMQEEYDKLAQEDEKALDQAKKDHAEGKEDEYSRAHRVAEDNRIRHRTTLANRLNALMQLKAKINTTNGWFSMLNDKFKIKTHRADAAAITASIDQQIEDVKQQLNDLFAKTGEYDTSEFTDADWLRVSQEMDDISTVNRDEIVEAETTSALLAADRAVNKKYMSQFTYGIVSRDAAALNEADINRRTQAYIKSGLSEEAARTKAKEEVEKLSSKKRHKSWRKINNYGYNPFEYEQQRNEREQQIGAILKGQKRTPHSTPKAYEADPAKDAYVQRVRGIIDADERNAKINWMLNDIYEGDAVSRIEGSVAEEFGQSFKNGAENATTAVQNESEIDKLLAQIQQSQSDTSSQATEAYGTRLETKGIKNKGRHPIAVTRERKSTIKYDDELQRGTRDAISQEVAKIKEKYREKKERAKKWRNNTLADYRRNRRGRLSLTLPFEGPIVESIIRLVNAAAKGIYTIEQFFDEVALIYKMTNTKMSGQDVSELKQAYRLGVIVAAIQNKDIDVMANVTPDDKIAEFTFKIPAAPDLEQRSPAQKMQGILNVEQSKIIEDVSDWYSTFVKNDDGTVQIYSQFRVEEYEFNKPENSTFYQKIKSVLDAATDKKSFDEALDKLQEEYKNDEYRSNFDFQKYKDYYGVDGINDAIAKAFYGEWKSAPLLNGIAVRDNVLNYFITGDESWLQNIEFVNDNKSPHRFKNDDVIKFVEDIRKLYDSVKNTSYKLINTHNTIYGIVDGRRVAAQADLVFINDAGDIVVYDVITSYKHFTESAEPGSRKAGENTREEVVSIHDKISRKSDVTHIQKFAYTLRGVVDILQAKTNSRVKDAMVLPVQVDPRNNVFALRGKFHLSLSDINTQIGNTQRLEDVQKNVNDAVEEYNTLIDEYNTLLEKLSGSENEQRVHKDQISVTDSKIGEGVLSNINNEITTLREDIDALNQKIQEEKAYHRDQRNEKLQEDYRSRYTTDDVSTLIEQLTEVCSNLDAIMSKVAFVKPTTAQEIKLFDEFRNKLYDAEVALLYVLSNPYTQQLDITQEMQLILNAVEKACDIQNGNVEVQKNLFSTFIRMLISSSEGFKTADEFTGAIAAWNKALNNDDLQNVIENNPAARTWYGQFLGSYYQKFLDRAYEFNQTNDDAVKKAILGDVITTGRSLVSTYLNNNQIDLSSLFADELSKINTTSIGYSYGDFHRSGARLQMESVTGAKDKYGNPLSSGSAWQRIGDRPNLLSESTVTLFKNDKGQIRVRLKTNDGVEVILRPLDNANGSISDMSALTTFEGKANAILNYVQDHPGCTVEVSISRTPGRFRVSEIDNTTRRRPVHSVTEKLCKFGPNKFPIHAATVSKENRIGIVVCKRAENMPTQYCIKTGDTLNDNSLGNLSAYTDETVDLSRIRSGIPVFLFDTGMSDGNGHTIQRAATLVSPRFSTAQVNFLSSLLEKYANGVDKVPGEPLTIEQQVSLWLCLDTNTDGNKFQNTESVVSRGGEGIIKIGKDEYNVNDPMDRTALNEKLATLGPIVQMQFANEKLSTSENAIIKAIRTTVSDAHDRGSDKVRIAGMQFTYNQFTTPDYTFLGYLLSNNDNRDSQFFGTYVVGNESVYPKITDIRVSDPSVETLESKLDINETPTEKLIQQEQEQEKQFIQESQDAQSEQSSDEADDGMDFMEHENPVFRTAAQQTEFVQACYAYVEKVLGRSVADRIQFGELGEVFLRNAGMSSRALGICTTACLRMSLYAPDSVMFHESFHQIVELCLDEADREELYNIYRSHAKDGASLSEREVAEGLCDMFTEYMTKKTAIKNSKGLKKLWAHFKNIAFHIGMFAKYHTRYATFIRLYNDINRGKYRDTKISEEKNKRFNQRFGMSLHYDVTNYDTKQSASFQYIKDSGELDQMVDGLTYYILAGLGVQKAFPGMKKINIDEWSVGAIPESVRLHLQGLVKDEKGNLTDKGTPTTANLAFREMFATSTKTRMIKAKKGKDGKVISPATTEEVTYYPNFAAVSNLVSAKVKSIMSTHSTDTKVAQDEVEAEASTDDGFVNANIDKFDRASYEFNKLDSCNSQTKMFFATIPYMVPAENKKGYEIDTTRNAFGLPTFMPMVFVYQTFVNEMNDCQTPEDLLSMMQARAGQDVLHARVYAKYAKLFHDMYKRDKDGNILKNKNGKDMINYDVQNLVINVFRAIKSQKLNFKIAKSTRDKDGNKTISIVNAAYDKDAATFPKQWSQFLLDGQTGVFDTKMYGDKYVLTADQRKRKQNVFQFAASFFEQVRITLPRILNANDTEYGFETTIGGVKYNLAVDSEVRMLKDRIVVALNMLGVQINEDSLNFMLQQKYGNSSIAGMSAWLNETGVSSLDTFITTLLGVVDNRGVATEEFAKSGYRKVGFVKELGDWQGKYNRQYITAMTEGMDMTKNYTISQNHAVSAICGILNRRDANDPTFNAIMQFVYNVSTNGISKGSIVLKAIAADKNFKLRFEPYNGFRTDNKNDYGVGYKEEPQVEDAMARIKMLQDGYLVPPTFADKGTWGFISIENPAGTHVDNQVKIPGLRYAKNKDGQLVVVDAPSVKWAGRKAYIKPNDQVLDQMIEYADLELAAINKCIEDLKTLPENQKTKNYYTNNDDVEPNGTRFLTLSSITVPVYDEKGKIVDTRVVNINDPRYNSQAMVDLANKEFFQKSREERRTIMALTLWRSNIDAVKKMESLGIVERFTAKDGDNAYLADSSDKNSLHNIQNIHLDENQINALVAHLWSTSLSNWNKLPNGNEKNQRLKIARSLAIAALLGDVTNRSIICEQESERLFIGHPGLFKVKYGEDKILDLCGDKQKRVGSLMSTGDDNARINGLPEFYTCAECKDYKISSKAQISERVPELFYKAELRHAYVTLLRTEAYDQINDQVKATRGEERRVVKGHVSDIALEATRRAEEKAFSSSEKEIEAALSAVTMKDGRTLLQHVKESSKKFSDSLLNGINVADGAAYITEDMCANLLRMNGAYTDDVDRAFKILANEASSWIDQKEATDIIYKKVSLVTTKYTAYGIRQHAQTGAAIHYVNKFALFPLFKCNATGYMRGIYEKMHNEHVDMMMMDSAVKVGSQGAIKFDGKELSEPFSTYQQPYSLLRKQLKTDPEEGDRLAMGTQAVKKVLSNLLLGRSYKHASDGHEVTGEYLRNSIMRNIQRLAEYGRQDVMDMFFDKDGGLDVGKLSKWLKSQMSDRDANIITQRAIEAVIQARSGSETKQTVKLALPLAATPDSHWVESILISQINKRVINVNLPGNSFVQRSVFAMEGDGYSVKDGSIKGATIYNGESLEMVNKEGSMDAVISIDYFDSIIPKDITTFAQRRQWLLDNGIIGSGAKANTIGYRIPTQAQSSIHALRFVDVVAATKATIILPQEFTKITGSDFDIDHLYLSSYHYKIDGTGKDAKATTKFEIDDRAHYENALLDDMMTLLKDTENSFTSLFKSIDNDTALVTSIAERIPDGEAVQHVPYIYGTFAEQVSRRMDYITGKVGIGPFALNCTNHVLTSLFHVTFKGTEFTNNTRIHRLDHIQDKDYNYIDAWMSAFINAHVDIVKDPYIAKLNVNKTTYNHLNLMVRSGYGDTSVFFLCHPVIRRISEINDMFSSKFAKDFDYKLTRKEKMMQALEPLIGKITEQDLALLSDPKRGKDRAKLINKLFETNEQDLITAAITGKSDDIEYNKQVYLAWKILEPYARAMNTLVQYTKIDTRKQGKNLIEIRRYLAGYHDLMCRDVAEDKRADNSIFDINTLDDLVNNSWINYKTETAISLPFEILGNQTFYANSYFMNTVYSIAQELTTDNIPSNQLTTKVARAVETYINAEFMHDWMEQQHIDVHKMFYGKWNIARTFGYLQGCIFGNVKTKDGSDLTRLKNNQLLKQLRVEPASDDYTMPNGKPARGLTFLTVSRNVDGSSVNSTALMNAWADLLDDANPAVRAFAQQLVAYAFVTSGSYQGWNKLFKYVPFEWRAGVSKDSRVGDMSYGEFIENKLRTEMSDSDEMLLQIVGNNFLDTDMVPKASLRNNKDEVVYYSVNNQRDPISPNVIGRFYEKDDLGVMRVPKFVAIRRENKCYTQQVQYDLYMCISQTAIDAKEQNEYGGFVAETRGAFYVKIPKLGYHVKNGFDIYEYDGISANVDENQINAVPIDEIENGKRRLTDYLNSAFEANSEDNPIPFSVAHIAEDSNFADALSRVYAGVHKDQESIDTEISENADKSNVSIQEQLIQHLSNTGIEVRNRAAMEQYLKEHGIENIQTYIDENGFYHAIINITQNSSGRLGVWDSEIERSYRNAKNILRNSNATEEEILRAEKVLDDIYSKAHGDMQQILDKITEVTNSEFTVEDAGGSWNGGEEYSFKVGVVSKTREDYDKFLQAISYAAEALKQDAFIENVGEIGENELDGAELLNGNYTQVIHVPFAKTPTQKEIALIQKEFADGSTEQVPLDATITDKEITFNFPSWLIDSSLSEKEKAYNDLYNTWYTNIVTILNNGKNGRFSEIYEGGCRISYERSRFHSADSTEGVERNYSGFRNDNVSGTSQSDVSEEQWEEIREFSIRTISRGTDGGLQFFTTPQGEVYGFVDSEGNIYLDETKISPEHPIHEYTHLWDRAVQKNNPELWQRGVELMKQTSLWSKIANDENYGKLWKAKGLPQEEIDNLIASEVHARFTGKGGETLLNQIAKEQGSADIVQKLKQWILDMWKDLKATFGTWSKEDLDKLTLKDFNHMTVRDFAEGINLNKIANEEMQAAIQLADQLGISEEDAQDIIEKGKEKKNICNGGE